MVDVLVVLSHKEGSIGGPIGLNLDGISSH